MREAVVLTKIDDRGIAFVTLNRPEVFNGYNEDMVRGLAEELPRLSNNPDVRLLVLRGAGKHFSAGADINWFKELAVADAAYKLQAATWTTQAMRSLFEFAKPTLALVHNACLGGGTGYAAACDIVIASEDAKFSVAEVRLGITPAPILPQCIATIGLRHARRYALTGETFDVNEAYRIGLVHEICAVGELDEAAAPIIDALMLSAPSAVAETKRMILDITGTRISDELADRLASISAAGRDTDEGIEGYSAFLEKRYPSWYFSDA